MPTTPRVGRSPLTAAQQEMAVKYLPLARSLARPFKRCWPTHRDDFDSAACCALVETAGTFDPTRGVKFSTFLRHRVWGALRDVQRSLVALGWRCDPAHAPTITRLPHNPEGRGRVVGADLQEPVGRDLEGSDEVEHWLRKLPAPHARVCRRVYLHGESQHEAARTLGCSQSRLSCLHREAMAILNGTWAEKVRRGGGPEQNSAD